MANKTYTQSQLDEILGAFAVKGLSYINEQSEELNDIYQDARDEIRELIVKEYKRLEKPGLDRLTSIQQRRYTRERLIYLYDELEKKFPAFDKKYKERIGTDINIITQGYYKQALNDIGKDGVNVLGSLDTKRIERIQADAFDHVAVATKMMRNDEITKLRRITKRVMTKASFTGDTRREISKSLLRLSNSDATFRFIDKAGRQWDLKSYFNMLGRTILMNSSRDGYMESMKDNGYDLARVSISGNPCPGCAVRENRIVSVFGKTKGYPTLEDAKSQKPTGLFHPNCTHRINVVPKSMLERKFDKNGRPKSGLNSNAKENKNSDAEWSEYRKKNS